MHNDLQHGIDRILLASYQTDKARGARALAERLIRALAKLEVREGVLIAQLDELVLGQNSIVASVPFLPTEPVALCLTGTPRLVAAVRSSIQKSTRARFALVRPAVHLQGLRVAAAVRDATVTLDVSRELGARGPGVLAAKGWRVRQASGDFESDADQTLLEAEATLGELSEQDLKPYLAPAEEKRSKRPQAGSSVLAKYATKRPAARPGGHRLKKKPACPKCGSNKVLPIEYGYPTPAGEAAARTGKVVLGGCIVSPDQPEWHCAVCEHEWAVRRNARMEEPSPSASMPPDRPRGAKDKSFMSRFAGTHANVKGLGAIKAIGEIPSKNSGPLIYLDEDWLKKLRARRLARRKKAARKS